MLTRKINRYQYQQERKRPLDTPMRMIERERKVQGEI